MLPIPVILQAMSLMNFILTWLVIGVAGLSSCGPSETGDKDAVVFVQTNESKNFSQKKSFSARSDASLKNVATVIKTQVLPPAPVPPTHPAPLKVKGFKRASHVGPNDTGDWPKPVVVVLHGNYDRPEWECDTWANVAGFYGWILCPRGKRTPWVAKSEDRWTYSGARVVQREIKASLSALEKRYPGRVSRKGMVLAGFSLGAILTPGIVSLNPGLFPYLFMVEGGLEKLNRQRIKSLIRLGVKGIGLAMSALGRRSKAKKILPIINQSGARAVFVDMKGAGHEYSDDFIIRGEATLRKLLFKVDKAKNGK